MIVKLFSTVSLQEGVTVTLNCKGKTKENVFRVDPEIVSESDMPLYEAWGILRAFEENPKVAENACIVFCRSKKTADIINHHFDGDNILAIYTTNEELVEFLMKEGT